MAKYSTGEVIGWLVLGGAALGVFSLIMKRQQVPSSVIGRVTNAPATQNNSALSTILGSLMHPGTAPVFSVPVLGGSIGINPNDTCTVPACLTYQYDGNDVWIDVRSAGGCQIITAKVPSDGSWPTELAAYANLPNC